MKFTCSLVFSIEGQTISMELTESQLWHLQFESSATMAYFYERLRRSCSYSRTDGIYWKLSEWDSLSSAVQIVPFQITKGEEKEFYYQQRFHSTENEEVQHVGEFIGKTNSTFQKIVQQSILKDRIHEPVTCLSTGEFKIACLLKSINSEAKILVIEDLFAGLDEENRKQVLEFLKILKQTLQTCIIVTSTQEYETSTFDYTLKIASRHKKSFSNIYSETLSRIFSNNHQLDNFQFACKLSRIKVKYADRVILHDISWQIKRAEKWALRGKNGTGKSTLLSIINADHPQAYANDVVLFDQLREYGTNIWEIKERIGYFSHELFRFFDKSKTVREAVMSIVSNPYRPIKQESTVLNNLVALMQYFDVRVALNTQLFFLQPYQQRLIVLLGVLLKNAPLLIFDEPYHFFDRELVSKFNYLIDNYMNHKTLIFVSHNEEDFPSCIDRHFYLS